MCGIAGIVTDGSVADIDRRLVEMSRRLAHRGPDDLGYLQYDGTAAPVCGRDVLALPNCRVALLHRRLAILDLSEAAWQPMASADGKYFLVFNGEIYNYRELRDELEKCGHTFRSQGDTEVLLAALIQWGAAALNRLVGMFAFALLDLRGRRLLLARDPFGIKPLYFTSWGPHFAFASELKALLALPDAKRQISPQRAYQYLRFGMTDHGSQTMVRGMQQVAAGSFLELPLDAPTPGPQHRYWQLDTAQRLDLTADEAAEHLRDLFLQNIELHMRSDVPIGAALSGGIDSSSIVMSMRQVAGEQLDLRTISYIATNSDLNEERYAELVSRAAAAKVHKVTATPQDLTDSIDDLIDSQDEPFGSTSIFAQRQVFRSAAEQRITVMLDGQGADELLAGYRHYLAARVASLLRRGRPLAAMGLLRAAARLPNSGQAPAVWLHAAGLLLPPALHGAAMQIIGQNLLPAWLNAAWFREREVAVRPPRPARGPDYLRRQLRISLEETSLPALLRYEDRNSMAFSIESRVPFLTPDLAQFVLSLPENYLIGPAGVSKAVFRQAMRTIVPDEILNRNDKIGFATPEASWLRQMQPWIEHILDSDTARAIPAIDHKAMRMEWQRFLNGRAHFDFRFWRWVNFIRWVERRGIVFD